MQKKCHIYLKDKNIDIKLGAHNAQCVSGITFIRYHQDRKIGKPNNLKVFESNETKGTNKKDSQNLLRSSMSAGGEP